MVFHNKPIGSYALFFQSAAGKLKDTFTLTAIKVVVMVLSGSFIQRPKRWMGDPFQPPFIDQQFEVAIDR